MAWIGIECAVPAPELALRARQLRGMGCAGVADFLDRAAKLVSGDVASAANADDRMREIEARVAADVARRTQNARLEAGRLMAAARLAGADAERMAAAMATDGWRGGSAAGDKNGGVANQRRRRTKGRGVVAYRDGEAAATAEKGGNALDETLGRDARYGASYEGWAATELQKMGFKMRHVARGVGLDVPTAWRAVSGYSRHWKRRRLAGVSAPEVPQDWRDRLETAVAAASGQGLKGAAVVLNGTRDCGDDDESVAVSGEIGRRKC